MPQIKLDQVRHRKIVDSCRRLGQVLQNSLRSDGRKRYVESSKSVAEANSGKLVHKTKIRDTQNHTEGDGDNIYGDDIMKLLPADEKMYNINFPYRRGAEYLHKKVLKTHTRPIYYNS